MDDEIGLETRFTPGESDFALLSDETKLAIGEEDIDENFLSSRKKLGTSAKKLFIAKE